MQSNRIAYWRGQGGTRTFHTHSENIWEKK